MSHLYDVTDMLNVSSAISEWEDNPRDNRAIGEAVLDDVAPRLVAQALRNAAQQIRDGYTCDPNKTPRDVDPECVAFDDAIRYLRATADEIEAGRDEAWRA